MGMDEIVKGISMVSELNKAFGGNENGLTQVATEVVAEKVSEVVADNKVIKVISAFPGVGKSWMFNNQQDLGLKVSDSDSSNFSWLSKGVRHPDFPNNYIEHIKDAMQTNDVVLVSSHDVVRDALTQAGIEFLTVYPNISDKDEYLQRFIKRGSDQAFVKLINDNWDEWISNINKNAGDLHVELNLGEYLSDFVLDRHTKDSKLTFSISGKF